MKKVLDKTNGQDQVGWLAELNPSCAAEGMKASNSLSPWRVTLEEEVGRDSKEALTSWWSAIRKTTWLQSRKIETQVNQNWLSERKELPPFAGHSFYLMNIDDFKNVTK